MADLPLLSVIIFLPLLGAIFIMMMKGEAGQVSRNARNVALWASSLTLILSLLLWMNFDGTRSSWQFTEQVIWIHDLSISYHLGIDGLSLYFVLLSAFLTPIAILAGWQSIQVRVREFMIALLLLETFLMGVFCALDMILFYVFFEGVLIPMFLIIGIWGGERRIYACFKFFLYTFLGSVMMLVAILTMYHMTGSMDLLTIMDFAFPMDHQKWLWLAFFAAFAIKIPLWPFHTWLPDAHVEAPTAGSVMLAGILLKIGAYGFLRFSIPLFPGASAYFAPFMITLSCIAILYGSLVALVQTDMKKLVAYSSIAHMGFVTLGIFSLTLQGMSGAVMQMISHGVVSAALFLCVGILYERHHSREIIRYGGLASVMPLYAVFFLVFSLASIGLPGTSGFVGEFLVLAGSFQKYSLAATLAATGMVLSAAYALWLYRRIIFGKLIHADLKGIRDLNSRETALFVSLAGLVLWIGLYPAPFLKVVNRATKEILDNYQYRIKEENGYSHNEDLLSDMNKGTP
jgi:NADH-quinone oxidoreductase subunit M